MSAEVKPPAHDPEKWEPVLAKDHAPNMTSGGYLAVPAKSIDAEQLMRFADVVWPDRPRERILATWWRRGGPPRGGGGGGRGRGGAGRGGGVRRPPGHMDDRRPRASGDRDLRLVCRARP